MKYDVEIEYLDAKGNVYDSTCVLLTDSEEEADKVAMDTTLCNENEQVAVWEWSDDNGCVEDSWVVKTYTDQMAQNLHKEE